MTDFEKSLIQSLEQIAKSLQEIEKLLYRLNHLETVNLNLEAANRKLGQLMKPNEYY